MQTALKVVMEETAEFQTAVSDAELRVLRQRQTWTARDRAIASRALEAIIWASIEYLGFKRFTLPIEYLAAAIVCCVPKHNWRIACNMLSDVNASTAAQIAGYEQQREQCTVERLWAVVLLLEDEYDRVFTNIDRMFKKAAADDEELKGSAGRAD